MKMLTISTIFLLLCGCSMPVTSVRSVDSRPSIIVKGTSPEAELLVDGLNVGKATTYNGKPQALIVQPGTHKISIIENGRVIYEQTVFVESEVKTINVH